MQKLCYFSTSLGHITQPLSIALNAKPIDIATAWVQLVQPLLTVRARARAAIFSPWSRAKGKGKGEAWP